jgi:hypothetical protein
MREFDKIERRIVSYVSKTKQNKMNIKNSIKIS